MPARVEIAFGVDPFDDTTLDVDNNWTDVSDYVRRVDYRTSTRSDRFAVFAAGLATIDLDNTARLFDADYAAGTYYGQLKRSVPVRIIGEHSGTDYVQWYGYATAWLPRYRGPNESVTQLTAHDGLGLLSHYDLAPLGEYLYGSENCGVRIGRVLDNFGFPSGYRDLDTDGFLAETKWGVNALAHCQQVAASAPGVFYAQRDGTLTFDGHGSLVSTRQTTSQDTFGGSGDPGIRDDGSYTGSGVGLGFRNLVRIGRSGGEVQEVDNTSTNEAPVSYQRTDLLMFEDGLALGVAQFYADLYGTEIPHPNKLRMLASSISGNGNTELFPRKIRDLVTVKFSPPDGGAGTQQISSEVFIDGVHGVIDAGVWTVEYTLSSGDAYVDNLASAPSTWLILDDATKGKLDSARTLSY